MVLVVVIPLLCSILSVYLDRYSYLHSLTSSVCYSVFAFSPLCVAAVTYSMFPATEKKGIVLPVDHTLVKLFFLGLKLIGLYGICLVLINVVMRM